MNRPTVLLACVIALAWAGVPAGSLAADAGRASGLGGDEAATLAWMREEEKLAHDVYADLAARWPLPFLARIQQSEARHFDAMGRMLQRYGQPDPARAAAGDFADPRLQSLYATLAEQGSRSEIDALRVGALIEETDILDLQQAIAGTDEPVLLDVYRNLLDASHNHLRHFADALAASGVVYEPQRMEPAQYRQIVARPAASGRGGRHHRQCALGETT